MLKIDYKKELLLWLFLLAPVVYLAFVWNNLPDRVPIHFNFEGKPNGWGGKATEFIPIVANLFIYLVIFFIPKIDPKKLDEGTFYDYMYKFRLTLNAFFSLISIVVIYMALPGHEPIAGKWIVALCFLLLALMGNFIINVKPNWFIGIRTPWTLSSDVVWRKTHQVGGRLFFYGGLICLALLFVLHGKLLRALLLTYIFGTTFFVLGYSFYLYKQLPAGGEEGNKPVR